MKDGVCELCGEATKVTRHPWWIGEPPGQMVCQVCIDRHVAEVFGTK